MTNSESNRLDRLERLLESIAQKVDSNARAIEALSNDRARYEQQAQLDRNRLYQAMTNLANAQANMATTHAEFQGNIYARQQELDERQEELSRRQSEIVNILKVISEKL